MVTVTKLDFGVIKVTAKGVKLFLDKLVDGGKTPDMRIDEGEFNGLNQETHVHFGDGDDQSVGEDIASFLLGTTDTNYNFKKREKLRYKDYILSDDYTLKNAENNIRRLYNVYRN